MDISNLYKYWCSDPYFDQETRDELKTIAGNEDEIKERFYKELEFGTGGLRGVIGAGTNRINRYTVRKATQGLANYICMEKMETRGVVIAYDSRHMSELFAEEATMCLAANNIKVYLFDSLRPTPVLSFAVRHLSAVAGIVITASHNPAEYNGYKVYWSDGGQITSPVDRQIMEKIKEVRSFTQVKTMSREEAKERGLYQSIGSDMDDKYMEELKKLVQHPKVLKRQAEHIKIVYTPLHGTGNLPVQRILKELGFTQVFIVKEQELPDGNFPTVTSPNPEDKKAFSMALSLAKQVDADLILATDPDADRLGIYGKERDGSYRSFTGNMSGMLLMEYILSQKAAKKQLPENSAVVTTIVSGKMAKGIAKKYQVSLIETLTGFKYIGQQIKEFEEQQSHTFLFGFEESYGCLVGTYARDKDAVSAVMALCEAAAWYREQGLTLCEQMEKLYQEYGYYKEDLCTITLQGASGRKKIDSLMSGIRNNIPQKIGDFQVIGFRDYQTETPMDLPKSDVIYFELEHKAWCCVRPSGTEPKMKFYLGIKGRDEADAELKMKELTNAVKQLAQI